MSRLPPGVKQPSLIPTHNVRRRRGAIAEGDVFAALRRNQSVIRSFENAVADGAVVCSGTSASTRQTSWADRFYRLLSERDRSLEDLLLFDVKGSTGFSAHDQIFLTTLGQMRRVAFYICICASDTSFVMLIPNVAQESQPSYERQHDDDIHQAVTVARTSWLPPSDYVLDPGRAGYAMPVTLLSEAIDRVQAAARGGGVYVNPWSNVPFPDWHPSLVSMRFLMPREGSQLFTSLNALRDIYTVIACLPTASAELHRPRVDFVGLQPSIADFKIVLEGNRQYFVQHKLDSCDRSSSTRPFLADIGRKQESRFRWYFTEYDRFDFFLYEFYFELESRPRKKMIFMPESAIPDRFYTTLEQEEDFGIEEFEAYTFWQDSGVAWGRRILDIVRANPQPRRKWRPSRVDPQAPDQVEKAAQRAPPVDTSNGRHRYRLAMTSGHRQFFHTILSHCALQGSGLIIALNRDSPFGDFCFVPYTWSEQDKASWIRTKRPPRFLYQLPASTPAVCLQYLVHGAESTHFGPPVHPSTFRRLNSLCEPRLVIWSLFGSDEQSRLTPLAIIPSDDIRPTTRQRTAYAAAKARQEQGRQPARDPRVSDLLSTGIYAADYTVGAAGPEAFGGVGYHIWRLFVDFVTSLRPIQHPRALERSIQPSQYRHQLSRINRAGVEEDLRSGRCDDE